MIDLDQFTTVAGLGTLIALFLLVFCPLVPGQPRNPRVPYIAIGIGVLISLAVGYSLGRIVELKDVTAWFIGGMLGGLAGIGFTEAARIGRDNGDGYRGGGKKDDGSKSGR
jgi:hypothetical protein